MSEADAPAQGRREISLALAVALLVAARSVKVRLVEFDFMNIRRIVPYLQSGDFDAAKEFYVGVLGLEVGMDDPEYPSFIDFGSPANPSAQIVVVAPGVDEPLPRFAVDVGDGEAVERAHAEAVARGLEVVYPLTDEPWGIRRFFVRDPTGAVVSIIAHVD